MSQDYGTTSASPPRSSSTTLAASSPRPTPGPGGVKQDGHASVLSSVTNLTNTVIGAGALAFPSAFAAMGLLPGIVSCAFSACTTIFGLYLLSRCATMVGKRPGEEGRKASFNEVARLTFGKGWVIRLFDLAIIIKCFGVSVSYLIICKTLLPQVCMTFSRVLRHPLSEHSILLSQDFWLVAVMFVIVPLSFLRTLDSLRFTSQIALVSVAYMIIVVVGWFVLKGVSPTRGEVRLGRFASNTLSSFPVQVFAYTCAQNIFPIYNELKDKTQKRMNTVIFTSIGSACLCYEVLGIIGYITFGSKVGSNIIAMYPASSVFIALGRLGIVLLVGLSYPLQLLPCRECVNTLTSPIKRRHHPSTTVAGPEQVEPEDDDDEQDEEDPLVPKDIDDGHGHASAAGMSNLRFMIITIGILVSGFIVALSVDELEVVLGFVGSTGSTIISFILPGAFYYTAHRDKENKTKWWALLLAMYGCFVMVFCLTFNILHVIHHDGPAGH
ncbi:putative transporter [Naematelia encephala]|uniref:Putative transporter n=1 Tax=Naematelia encephala TaxID=71784 RepID=A0A1Y2ARG4_9TREE|nr:putative transporter [Naematelia encephala]